MQVAASGVNVLMNTSLLRYGGDLAVGAFGIVNTILGLLLITILGLNQGTQPILGYNYGAGNYKRVRHTLYYTLKVATIITTAGFIIGELFPRQIAMAFTTDTELLDLTERGVKIAVIALPLVGMQIVASSFFQSLGYAFKSIIQSLSRQLIFLVPGIILFPRLWGLDGLWVAIPVSDTLAAILSLTLLIGQIRILKRMEQEADQAGSLKINQSVSKTNKD
jgi:Na+-driven multidrug efflux pump